MKSKPLFEQSTIDSIPEDWNASTIGEFSEIRTGGTPSKKHPEYFDGNVKWIRSGDVHLKRIYDVEGRISNEGVKNSNAKPLPSESILIALNGRGKTRATVAMLKTEAACNQSLAAIIIKNKQIVIPEYLFYHLENRYVILRNLTGDNERSGLNLGIIQRITVPIPPFHEQEKIVEVLSLVDKCRQKSNEIFNKTKLIKTGLIQNLVTEGINHKKYKKTEFGKIPEKWTISTLADSSLITLVMGQSPSSSSYNYNKEGLPFIQGNAEFGEIFPSPKMYTKTSLKISEKDDTLVSVRAPVGDVNLNNSKCCIGRGLAAIRPNKTKFNPLFIFYYMIENARKLSSVSTGSTFKAIRKSHLEDFPIVVPPLEEQEKIVNVLSSIDSKIHLESKRIEHLTSIKQGLMDDLLTGQRRLN